MIGDEGMMGGTDDMMGGPSDGSEMMGGSTDGGCADECSCAESAARMETARRNDDAIHVQILGRYVTFALHICRAGEAGLSWKRWTRATQRGRESPTQGATARAAAGARS